MNLDINERMDYYGRKATRIMVLIAVSVMGMTVFTTGCQNILEPAAEVGILSFEPNPLQAESGGTDGSATLPLSDLKVKVFNGVPLTIDAYQVYYTGPDGILITSPPLSSSGKLSLYIKPAVRTADEALTEDVTLSLRVLSEDVYNYIINGTTTETGDDISPVTATVRLYGVDDNRYVCSAACHIPIDSRFKE